MTLPTIFLDNIAPNFVKIVVSTKDYIVLYYMSYGTIVGLYLIQENETDKMFVSENIWGKTTGKHLNIICPDKKERLLNSEFKKILNDYGIY